MKADGKIDRRRESVSNMDLMLQNCQGAECTLNQPMGWSPQDQPFRCHSKCLNQLAEFTSRYQLKNGGRHFDQTREFSHKSRGIIPCSSLADVASQQKELKNDAFSSWHSRSTSDPWRNGRIRFRCHGN
ncbi:uncharacterized protein [Macrobrachium rosenbergii]|uniref:uncharacterized protein isoform X2 n=1 Tax=Macrobrachium rosenbergii TaxID=79674 RepID=UPI0034D43AE8